MNKFLLLGNWNIAKGKVVQKLARMNDDADCYMKGKQAELYGRIQKRVGEARSHLRAAVKSTAK